MTLNPQELEDLTPVSLAIAMTNLTLPERIDVADEFLKVYVASAITAARIEELEKLHFNIVENPKWRSDSKDQAFAYGRVHHIIDERIAELSLKGEDI